MNVPWSKNDELFLSELRQGHDWQWIPAFFLSLRGLNVDVPQMSFRKSISEAHLWIDTVDMWVNGWPVEVKSRRERFTGPVDFPYGNIIIDTVSGFNDKKMKPIAYIMISRETCAMSVISVKQSKPAWTMETKNDNVRGIVEHFYCCPKRYMRTMDELVNALVH